MLTRCGNKRNPKYPAYGGRGIKVCEEWQTFEPFNEWAMANGYRDSLTIDRIDNDGDYCPENCRWATYSQQANNTRETIVLSFNGEEKTLSEWSALVGIPRQALWKRIFQRGWTIEKALTTPLQKRNDK
jgi:hypothetical protein